MIENQKISVLEFWLLAASRNGVATVFVISALIQLILNAIYGLPTPIYHDEFAYLYGAETFASWHLTNPAHPMWHFFESVHTISQPTSMMKYLPGQSLIMSLGIILLGHAHYGIILSVALLCAALCWAVRPLVSNKIFWLFGALILTYFSIWHYWSRSYWGPGFAACGAAIALGGFIRLHYSQDIKWLTTIAIGGAILALTRPLEGLLLILPLATISLATARLKFIPILYSALIAVITIAFLLYYNQQITGDYFTPAYLLHQRQYDYTPSFWFLPKLTPLGAANPIIDKIHSGWEFANYDILKDSFTILTQIAVRLGSLLLNGLSGLTLIFIYAIFIRKTPLLRILWLLFAISLLPVIFVSWNMFHYGFVSLIIAYIICGISLVNILANPTPLKKVIVTSIIASSIFINIAMNPFDIRRDKNSELVKALQEKSAITEKLSKTNEQHLIFIKQNYNSHSSLVNSVTNPDTQKILWAHDRGEIENKRLILYYPNRKAWLLDIKNCCELKPAS